MLLTCSTWHRYRTWLMPVSVRRITHTRTRITGKCTMRELPHCSEVALGQERRLRHHRRRSYSRSTTRCSSAWPCCIAAVPMSRTPSSGCAAPMATDCPLATTTTTVPICNCTHAVHRHRLPRPTSARSSITTTTTRRRSRRRNVS